MRRAFLSSSRTRTRADFHRVIVLCCCLLGAADLQAARPYVETEPNDTPERAAAFRAPANLMGAMPGGDQDAWLWIVSDDDAGRTWDLELQGLPGRLTIADIGRVRYDAAGNAAGFDRLLKISSRDGAQPAVLAGLLFEPGEYLIGMARSGGSSMFRPASDSLSFGAPGGHGGDAEGESASTDAYRLIFQQGNRVPASSGRTGTNRDTAIALEAGSETAAVLEDAGIWYRFDIPEEKATSRWDIGLTCRTPSGLGGYSGAAISVHDAPSSSLRWTWTPK